MSLICVRSGRYDVHEGVTAKDAETGALPPRIRLSAWVAVALAGLLAGGVHAAGTAVPLSIEGGEFRVGADVNTRIVSHGAHKQVEEGTTADGLPVVITRLSYRKVPLGRDEATSSVKQEDTAPSRSGEGADGAPDGAGQQAVTTKTLSAGGDVVPFLMHAVTPRSVSIAWHGNPEAVYNVYRDGQLLAQATGARYVDETVSPGTEYQYSIEALSAPSQASGLPAMSGQIHLRTLDEGGAGAMAGAGRVTKKIKGRRGPSATLYKHRTFIPDEWVDVAWYGKGLCGVNFPWERTQFKGDNRDWNDSFDLDRDKSRTEILLSVNWAAQPVRISRQIHVSETTRLVNGEKEYYRTARENDGWYVDGAADGDGSYVLVSLNHDIGNPFCQGTSILYRENVHMWNDGSLFVEGLRRKAPRHEGLMMLEYWGGRRTRGPWSLFREENEGFHCLGPDIVCGGKATYRGSHGR